MEDLPGSSLLTTVVHKTLSLKILPRGVDLCRRNSASTPSMIALESVEWFDLRHIFFYFGQGQSTPYSESE